MQIRCHKCNKINERQDNTLSKNDTCDFCSEDLKCCKNCKFYSVNEYNECKETQAERILDKVKSNFCDYFSPSNEKLDNNANTKKDEIFKKLDDLFK